jgi:hypothetical protein
MRAGAVRAAGGASQDRVRRHQERIKAAGLAAPVAPL